MKDTNIQWHPAFVSAMHLEFKEYREKLLFEKEHNLNTKPLQIDLLVIKKENASEYIGNEIGRLFRKYNVIEYKSPKQQLDVDVFYKTQSYAALYKSYGKVSNERKAKDVTVSIVRDRKPEKLFQYFVKQNVIVENPFDGIYYILGEVLFPTQIIVTKELNREHHTWLRSLTDKLEEKDMRRLLVDTSRLKGKQDKEFADSVLEVCFRANEQIIEKLKGDDTMSEALLEIMEPLIEPIIAERIEPIIAERIEPIIAERIEPIIAEQKRMIEIQLRKEIRDEDIKGLVSVLHDLGNDDNVIRAALKKQYHLSDEEINNYL